MDRDLIDQYANGGQTLVRAVQGLSREELLATPVAGKWSTHQVVIHLADAEASFVDRIKRVVAMDSPLLLAWDENQFIDRLHYTDQSVEDAVTIVDLTRRQLGRVLRLLHSDVLNRAGQHSERGPQTLKEIIDFANRHLEHHLKFVAEKRIKLGKPA